MKKSKLMRGLSCIAALMVLCFVFGCSSSSSTTSDPDVSLTGTILDPPVKDAKVFADFNGNGILDDGEPWAMSNKYGNFKLKTKKSKAKDKITIVSIGGTDVATGKKIKIKLKSKGEFKTSPDIIVLNSLTTLAVKIGETKVKESLSITNVADLFTYNPLAEAQKAGASEEAVQLAVLVQKTSVKVINTLTTITTTVTSAASGASEEDVFDAGIDALADGLDAGTFTADSFEDTTAVTSLLDTTVETVQKTTTVSTTQIEVVKTEIVALAIAVNNEVENVEVVAAQVSTSLIKITATQVTTHEEVSTSVTNAVTTGSTTSITTITNSVSTLVTSSVTKVNTEVITTIVTPDQDSDIDDTTGTGSAGGTDV